MASHSRWRRIRQLTIDEENESTERRSVGCSLSQSVSQSRNSVSGQIASHRRDTRSSWPDRAITQRCRERGNVFCDGSATLNCITEIRLLLFLVLLLLLLVRLTDERSSSRLCNWIEFGIGMSIGALDGSQFELKQSWLAGSLASFA